MGKAVGKVLISAVLAFFVLTLFAFFYANTPLQYKDPDGATDYRWEGHKFYSHGTEGFSFGTTNNEGYYNPRDYMPGDPVDVLIMGSSQLEGSNVQQEHTATGLLNARLSGKNVYNISVSAHTFLICVNNLEAALRKYRPTGYVILEAERAQFTEEELRMTLAETIPDLAPERDNVTETLRKNPYITLLARQARNYLSSRAGEDPNWNPELDGDGVSGTEEIPADESAGGEDAVTPETDYETLYDMLLRKIKAAADTYDTEVIVLYHPPTQFYDEVHIEIADAPGASEVMRELCEKNGILFLDMSGIFLEAYESEHLLPHGFSNTAVGVGHLNRAGHEMIADELFRIISASE